MGIKGLSRCLLAGVVPLLVAVNAITAELPELANPATGSGQPTSALFFGGATADAGSSYLDNYGPDDPLDILAEIHVEALHVNTFGNIYVVALADGQYYMQDTAGAFLTWNGDLAALVPVQSGKLLSTIEPLTIVQGFTFGSLGIAEVDIIFHVAYDTLQNPNEIFYNGSPIALSISDQVQIDTFQLYVDTISGPIVQNKCAFCHNATGLAKNSRLVYALPNQQNYQQTNFDTLWDFIVNEPGGSELILSKPQGIDHLGGVLLTNKSAEYFALLEFVNAVLNASGGGEVETVFSGVENIGNDATLRKAALLFAGRLPTPVELASVVDGGETELRQAIRGLMSDTGFTEFLMESANDRLLSEAFSTNLFGVVDRYYYPNSRQYFQAPNFVGSERRRVGEALAEEPLRLIDHVVSNERPYTEVLTADYIMVNPFSAKVYGGHVSFTNPNDPNEWREGEITEFYRCTFCTRNNELSYPDYNIPTVYPHAGLLNSPAFLQRFPSTSTNRNRARARWAYYFFLGVDIEGLAPRTTDPDALADEDNPTLNNPNCTVCHNVMDPVAGAFQNHGDDGFFRDQPIRFDSALPGSYRRDGSGLYQMGDTWYADMLAPGFGTKLAPEDDAYNSLQWLAQEFASDSRFGFGTVNFWYPAVVGREPLEQPENPEDEEYVDRSAAYAEERQLMLEIASNFVNGTHGNGNHNLKDLLVDLAMSEYFRAESAEELNEHKRVQLEDVGIGQLLTPEKLNRKLSETTGYEWDYSSANSLVDVYRLTYGGIDSFGITDRAKQLTTLMSSVVTAMANESSCDMVALDFFKAQNQRLLFPHVELSALPTTNPIAIKNNILYLHDRLLGEKLTIDDLEIEATYALFNQTWNARIDAGKGAQVSSNSELCLFENNNNRVTLDPNQTLRSWAVVINYLLRDYKFIHE